MGRARTKRALQLLMLDSKFCCSDNAEYSISVLKGTKEKSKLLQGEAQACHRILIPVHPDPRCCPTSILIRDHAPGALSLAHQDNFPRLPLSESTCSIPGNHQ
jgi:hypothetical protein